MTYIDWLEIIVPSVVSLLGFAVTIFLTCQQFNNIKKEKIIDRQSKLYLECYRKIEPIINKPMDIFKKDYYESIVSCKAEMKLIASNNTLRAYKDYLHFVYDIFYAYTIFSSEKDPENDKSKIEICVDESAGEEHENSHITEEDNQYYEFSLEKYQNEHCPDMKEIKKHIANLLNSMRKDLFNDSIASDIIE